MKTFSKLRMQKSSWMLLTKNIESSQKKKNEIYGNHLVNVFFFNPMSLMCHLILGS